MNKFTRRGLCLIVLLFSTLGFANLSLAESLPSGFLVGDESGFTAKKDGKYFIEHNDIKPGAKFTKEIVISNYAQEKDPIEINLLMNPDDTEHIPESTGKINLLEIINVKLTLDGKELYDGLLDSTGKNKNHKKDTPLKLGKYKTGEVGNLLAEFTVSNDLPVEDWKEGSKVDFYWVFYATPKPKKEEPKVIPDKPFSKLPPELARLLPQTGEEIAFVLVGMVLGLALILLAISFYKRRNVVRK